MSTLFEILNENHPTIARLKVLVVDVIVDRKGHDRHDSCFSRTRFTNLAWNRTKHCIDHVGRIGVDGAIDAADRFVQQAFAEPQGALELASDLQERR